MVKAFLKKSLSDFFDPFKVANPEEVESVSQFAVNWPIASRPRFHSSLPVQKVPVSL